MEAMQSQTEDVTKRLRDIKGVLDEKDDSDAQVGEKLKLLDDLIEIVEHIDYAKGAPPLIHMTWDHQLVVQGGMHAGRCTISTLRQCS